MLFTLIINIILKIMKYVFSGHVGQHIYLFICFPTMCIGSTACNIIFSTFLHVFSPSIWSDHIVTPFYYIFCRRKLCGYHFTPFLVYFQILYTLP